MDNIIRLINEIIDKEKERNEMLKDSEYASFALSEDTVMIEALKAADSAIAREFGKALNG